MADNGENVNNNQIVCVGLVQDDDVVVFDAEGEAKRFRLEGRECPKAQPLCFSDHGHEMAAEFLTPCLDDEGLHGMPDESCFCGVDEPHIHAHFHNEKTCSDHNQQQGKGDISHLAPLILTRADTEKGKPVSLRCTESLPSKCNSEEWTSHLSKAGVESNSSHGTDTALGRRMFKVLHGDHQDFLVQNSKTGDLHLEHECNDCGETDLHGRLKRVSTRNLAEGGVQLQLYEETSHPFSLLDFIATFFDPSSKRVDVARDIMPRAPGSHCHHEKNISCCKAHMSQAMAAKGSDSFNKTCCGDAEANSDGEGSCRKADCHSSVCGSADRCDSNKSDCCQPRPTRCGDGGDAPCGSSPVHHEHDAHPPAPAQIGLVRSSFVCNNICCSSEIPIVREILEEQEGVENIMVNIAMKEVTVDHHPELVSAKEIESALNLGGLRASMTRDGELQASHLRSPSNPTGRSHFFVEKICCASEIPMINKIVKPIPGVLDVSINVTTKMVYVDHDIHEVAAQEICDVLNKDRFGATIKKDANEARLYSLGKLVESTLLYTPATEPNSIALENFLLAMDKELLKHFDVDGPGGKFAITHNALLLPAASVARTVRTELSLNCNIEEDGGKGMYDRDCDGEKEETGTDETMSWPSIPTILSGIFWVMSLLSLVGGDWDYLKYVALLSVACGMPSIALKALGTLQRCRFDTNVLMLSAAIGAVALQEFSEAAAVTFLFSISEWLEVRATTRARNALSAIVRLRPEKANLILPNSKEMVTVPAAAVPVGALVSIRTGDKIPCDGEVVQGQSTVDESSLTGESRPVRKGPGDKVSGGTINSGLAELTVRTTATAENSAVAKLIRLVEEAQANRSETEKLVDEFAKRYTPLVLLAAVTMCTVPWFFGRETGRFWTHNGLVLLVVACPCALIISTPVTYVAGLAATAQKGILIKGGAHLEALAMVRKIFFDKTGTLTRGRFALLHLNVFNEHLSRKEVLQHLALVEERASHPLAEAIMAAIRNEGVSAPASAMTMCEHTQLAGQGVSAIVGGSKVCVGNERLFKRLELYDGIPSEIKAEAEAWAEAGGTVGFVSIGEYGVVCAYCVADDVREESASVVRDLKSMGIETTMLTGDNSDAALAIGAQVGLDNDEIRSQLFPEDKLNIVEKRMNEGRGGSNGATSVFSNPFKKQSLVLMCGDGVNDAPALATADVGVAMGEGAALAMETSDVTLLDSNLNKLVYSLRMGRRVIWKIRENIIFSFVVKAIVVGFAVAGKAELWAAIASDVGAMLVVTMNGMLLLPSKKDGEEGLSVESFTRAAMNSDPESGREESGNGTSAVRGGSTRSFL